MNEDPRDPPPGSSPETAPLVPAEGAIVRATTVAPPSQDRSFLTSLYRALPSLVWVKSLEGAYLSCNPAFERVVGVPEEALLGKTDDDLFPPELAATLREQDRGVVAVGRGQSQDVWLPHAETGDRCLFQITRTPMHDELGRVVGLLGVSHDVTARHQAELAARASRAELDELLDSLDEAVWAVEHPSLRTLYVSRSASALYGVPRSRGVEAAGALRRMVHPEDTQVYDALVDTLAKVGVAQGEHRIVRQDGTVRWLDQKIKVLPADDTRPARYVGISRDITARKEVEAELAQHREHLESLVSTRTRALAEAHARLAETQFAMDRLGIAVEWISVPDSHFVYVNDGACHMLGYSREELLCRGVGDLDPTYPGPRWEPITEALIRDGWVRVETEHRRKDGRLLPVELTMHYAPSSVSAGGGRVIAFATDITERRAQAQALLDAKEAAEAGNRAKSTFLATMSHEVRTPMNAILGTSYLLRRQGDLTPTQRERLERIDTAAQSLLSILEQVLALSKLEAEQPARQDGEVDIGALVSSVAGLLQERAAAKGLTLRVETATLPRRLGGDAERLRQALLNYGTNALKFTEHGSVTLRAFPLEQTPDDLLVRFEVVDTGIGVPPEALGRLFQAFEQADGSLSRKFGGAGLGLAIVRRIAESLGGEAGVAPAPGGGSTFWFTARVRRLGALQPEAAGAGPRAADEVLREEHTGRRVLLVDDDLISREVTAELLAEVGLEVTLAENGLEAVALAEKQAFDLILTDLQMPELDGLEATRRIRRIAAHERTPIIALTANVLAEDRVRCAEAGIDDFLPKPADPVTFFALLSSWLSTPRR